MKKNDLLRGVCIGYNHEGVGIVKANDFTFYVRGVLASEEVTFKIMKMNKKFGYGKLVEVIKVSDHRVVPECEYYGKCGGCQLQHMDMLEQLKFKHKFVEDNIRKIAFSDVDVENVLVYPFKGAYRNKAQFPVQSNGEVEIGFYRLHSNDIININTCMIQSDEINAIMQTIRTLLNQYMILNTFKHVLIKHAFAIGEVMVVFVSKENNIPNIETLVSDLVKQHPMIKSVILNVNKHNDNVILGNDESLLFGKDKICEELMGLKFNIASKSFYQVNPYQTKELYSKVLEYAQLTKNDTVIDLYCGVGSISLFLAQQAKQVIGIEVVDAAIANAKENAKMNNIDNIEFVCSDAGTYASKLVENKTKVDVIVVDPPRKGCDKTTIDSIVKMSPDRVVYVSCNPSTLARDIKSFEEQGYQCTKVQPVDMFPNTFHVETVALLSQKSDMLKQQQIQF